MDVRQLLVYLGVLAVDQRHLADDLHQIRFAGALQISRLEAIAELCKAGKADLVQVIGKMALIYRKNAKVNKQLSNVHRFH